MNAPANAASRPKSGEPSTGVVQAIVRTTVDSTLGQASARPLAIILAGSMGRGEQTIVFVDGVAKVLGDADFYLVFERPEEAGRFKLGLESLITSIERQLKDQGIICSVSFALPTTTVLSRMQPHIMGYELREAGWVVWGDTRILALIPGFGPADIPRWDAWRSISNRMIEHLGTIELLEGDSASDAAEFLYKCIKVQLELAVLVTHFCGRFQPTYRQRAETLRELQTRSTSLGSWWGELESRVETASSTKLRTSATCWYGDVLAGRRDAKESIALVREECEKIIRVVRQVWFWGAEELLGRAPANAEDPLETALEIARLQSWRWRARGWAHLLLRESAGRRPDCWGRFARLCRYGGPRFLTYAVAASLYFSWPDWMGREHGACGLVAERALPFLPVPLEPGKPPPNWLNASNAVYEIWQAHLEKNWA